MPDCPICDHAERAEIEHMRRDRYLVRDGKRLYWSDRREPTYKTIAHALRRQGVLSGQENATVAKKVSRHFRDHVSAR
jgi:hypothetical protein